MVYRCTYRRLYTFASEYDPGNWRWSAELDHELSTCECAHTLNVEKWEAERVLDLVKETNRKMGGDGA